jgi:hypothetical protein
MRIVTPTEIEEVAWEGALEPLGATYRGADDLPRVTLGEPAWWPAAQAIEEETGKKWSPPANSRRYTLLRLACTLHPPADPRTRYTDAALTAYLRPRAGQGQVVAHDLFPQRLTVEEKSKFTVALKPELKFAELFEASPGEIGGEIEYQQAFPVVQGYGLGESAPYWRFERHTSHPLLGCQSVYVVLDAPEGGDGVRVTIELVATVETRWGPLRLGLPEEARARVSRVVGV